MRADAAGVSLPWKRAGTGIARLVAMCPPGEEIHATALNDRISRGKPSSLEESEVKPMSLAEMEKKLIVAVLRHTADNRTHAADILGISREGLRTKMQRHGLTDSTSSPDAKP